MQACSVALSQHEPIADRNDNTTPLGTELEGGVVAMKVAKMVGRGEAAVTTGAMVGTVVARTEGVMVSAWGHTRGCRLDLTFEMGRAAQQ